MSLCIPSDLSIPDNVLKKRRYIARLFKKKRNGQKQYKIVYINVQWQIPAPFGSKLHIPPTNYHLLVVQQEPYKKACSLTKSIGEYSGGESQENGPSVEK